MSRLTKEQIPHKQHTKWKDGIDIEECTFDCPRCYIDALESELALNQAAIVREAADKAFASLLKHDCQERNIAYEAILAIPTDQPALDRHDVERDAPILALLHEHLKGRVYNDVEDAVRNLLQAFISIKGNQDDEVAERYITREEHNNIIHMNENIHERDVAERVREAVRKELERIVQIGFHADAQLDAYLDQRIAALRAAAGAPEETAEEARVRIEEGKLKW